MAHLNTVQNGIYTSLNFIATAGALSTMDTASELIALFGSASTPVEIKNIRDFPEFGNPSNIVNVPVYGSPTSTQVSGQSDLNTMEFTINYVASDFETQVGHSRVGDGLLYPFQIALTNVKPTGFKQTAPSASAGSVGGITGTLNQNTVFNFAGKIESLVFVPSLTDAITAKLTLSMATQLFGPVTY
jgi:hypothetical protein